MRVAIARPAGRSSSIVGERNSKHEQLIKLLTSMIRPLFVGRHGRARQGRVLRHRHALVVNQTADVIREVEDLLEALRRLQDLAVAVEVRIVSLSETFFERMGVDFAMNIKTHTAQFEPAHPGRPEHGPACSARRRSSTTSTTRA